MNRPVWPLARVQGFRLKVLQVAGGSAVAQALLVLAAPALTRLYTPADFGVLAVYMSLLALLVVLASLRYEFALPIADDEGDAIHLLAVCLVLVATTTALAALLLFLLRDRVLAWTATPGLRPYLGLVPLGVLGMGCYQVFTCWAIRKGGYARIARTRVTQSLTQVGLQLGLGALVRGPLGLLVGHAAGRTNGTRALAMLDWRHDWACLRQVRLARMWQVTVRFRRFPWLSSGSALMNACNLRLPALLLAVAFGPAVAGCFILAQRVFALPSSVIGEAVAQVYFGEFAQQAQRDRHGLMVLFRGTVRRMFLLGLPLMLGAMGAGRYLFPLVFGRDWREAGIFVVALAPMALAQFTAACADTTLMVLERQDLALYRELLRSGLLLSGILVAARLHWAPRPAIFLFGATGTLAYAVYGLVTWYAIRQHLRAGGAR